MDHEDIKPPTENPETPADPAAPPAGHSQASEPTAESKIELVSIESPTIAPMTSGMTGLARKPELRLSAEKSEAPERPNDAAPRETMQAAAIATARASPRFSKFSLLAASIGLAAAFGAMAGALGATGLARLVPLISGETATAQESQEPPILQAAIAQMRSEIAALKASVDTANRNTNTQLGKLAERFDRIERPQVGTNKADAALPKETTGSVTLPSGTAALVAPAPVPQSATAIVPGWVLRDVYRGVAMLQSRAGGMVEVEPGDVLPGLGRIEAIRRQDGRWVVITSKGMITSMR